VTEGTPNPVRDPIIALLPEAWEGLPARFPVKGPFAMNPILRTLLVCAALTLLSAPAAAQTPAEAAGWVLAPQVAAIGAADRVYGAAGADLSMIVWIDPECPYCKVFGATPERVVDASGGRLNLALRLYPLSFHGPNAVLASAGALCVGDQAGDAGYYKFMGGWLALTGGNGKGIAPSSGNAKGIAPSSGNAKGIAGGSANAAAAASLGAASGAGDPAKLAACIASPATAARIKADMADGETARITGTPAIAVRNNKTGETIMAAGALSQDDLERAVNYLAGRDGAPAGQPKS
jgi:protein-disulfide isomerase